jgi:hypothetical protein
MHNWHVVATCSSEMQCIFSVLKMNICPQDQDQYIIQVFLKNYIKLNFRNLIWTSKFKCSFRGLVSLQKYFLYWLNKFSRSFFYINETYIITETGLEFLENSRIFVKMLFSIGKTVHIVCNVRKPGIWNVFSFSLEHVATTCQLCIWQQTLDNEALKNRVMYYLFWNVIYTSIKCVYKTSRSPTRWPILFM